MADVFLSAGVVADLDFFTHSFGFLIYLNVDPIELFIKEWFIGLLATVIIKSHGLQRGVSFFLSSLKPFIFI